MRCVSVLLVLSCLLPVAESRADVSIGRAGDSTYQSQLVPFFEQPVNPDRYLVRPGEQFVVTFLGTRLPSLRLTVDAEGRVVDQNVGAVELTDRSLTEARRILSEALKRIYTAEKIVISIGNPLPVTVRVSGMVAKPGRYYAYSSQRVSGIIDSAGGIVAGGSVRRIRFLGPLGEQSVDLKMAYGLGETQADPYLYTGVHVVVPVRSAATVYVDGAVSEPGEIELIDSDDLNRLIMLAGGPLPTADITGCYLVNDESRDPAITGNIKSGDIIMVPSVGSDRGALTVAVFGAVREPGLFDYQDGMNVAQSLVAAGGAKEGANLHRVTVFRDANRDAWGHRADGSYPMSLKAASDLESFQLRPDDSVFVPMLLGYIRISGDVRFPGLYPYHVNRDVDYYITLAGGYSDNEEPIRVLLFDRISRTSTDASTGVTVRDGDEITVQHVEKEQ